MISWTQLGLQDGRSPVIEEFIFFHDFANIILIFILSSVGIILMRSFFCRFFDTGLLEGQIIESIWTLVPAIILIQIAIPSLILLYILDENVFNRISVKTVGHQWYWSYEYSDYWGVNGVVEYDSYIKKDDNILRILDVDNRLVLPFNSNIRVLVTSSDVLHSWAVPSLGVKADACPGRLNQVKFLRYRPGIFFGQCSEICGANHSFIPIRVEFINSKDFSNWIIIIIE